jgi:hypothetical protein
MNATIPDTLSFLDPYKDPLGFCGVVTDSVYNHYQAQLISQLVFYAVGGAVIGFGLAFILFLYMNRNKKV